MVRNHDGKVRADLVFSQKMVCQKINVVCGLQVVIKKCKNNIMCRHDVFSFLSLSCLESG